MTSSRYSQSGKIWKAFNSVGTGIILLIIVGLTSAAGTLILQRPMTDPEKMQSTYSPATLRWLDTLGLTDVFHA